MNKLHYFNCYDNIYYSTTKSRQLIFNWYDDIKHLMADNRKQLIELQNLEFKGSNSNTRDILHWKTIQHKYKLDLSFLDTIDSRNYDPLRVRDPISLRIFRRETDKILGSRRKEN